MTTTAHPSGVETKIHLYIDAEIRKLSGVFNTEVAEYVLKSELNEMLSRVVGKEELTEFAKQPEMREAIDGAGQELRT